MPLLELLVQHLVPHNSVDAVIAINDGDGVVVLLLCFRCFVAHNICDANEEKAISILLLLEVQLVVKV